MIGYVTLGTNDKKRAEKFYDELLKEIGAGRIFASEKITAYAVSPDQPGLGIAMPFDGKPATVGNGAMVALKVANPEKVKSFYNKAIALGAKDEGQPGPRGEHGFYAGYFRDLDGNKLNVFCFVAKK